MHSGFSAVREMVEAGLLSLGLEGQTVTMQWMQKYIPSLDGGSEHVVFMGESAGS